MKGRPFFFLYSADVVVLCVYSSSYLRMSPGTQFSSRQIASNVEKRIAFTLLFFILERFAFVIPTFSASSEMVIHLNRLLWLW